jgi:hypothetical protein
MIQVHMLVCENSCIIEMHGATIKDRKCTYNVTFRRDRATAVVVAK